MLLKRIIEFIAVSLVVANLVVLVESNPDSDCAFDAASYTGPSEKYIVILKDQTNNLEKHYTWLKKCSNKLVQCLSTEISSQSVNKNAVIDFSVKGKLNGYSGWFDPNFVKEQLAQRTEIAIVEKDAPVNINYAIPRAVQNSPVENLDRIDQAKFPLDGKYTFPDSAGAGVHVYVVDTGVLVTHSEFEGRATFGGSFCTGCPNTDDNGHGSHVSGIVAGKTFGVAKKANIIGVKVLDANGSGDNSGVINGLSFVLQDHTTKKNQSSVVNMSLGGAFSTAVNLAVEKLTNAGIHVVVAAGNDGNDACGLSPASEPSAITVGATEDTSDAITDFSDIGKCVDIFAPGRNIKSVGIASNTNTAIFSGTSQAAPHVAGTVALIIAKTGDRSPANMQLTVKNLGTKDVLLNAPPGTPNLFLRVPPV